MLGNILSCISMMWDLLCDSMSSANTQTQSSSPSDLLPSTTSQTQSSTVSCSTSSQTPSSSASFSTRWDVFLSFRGEDTRLNFTGHLYQRLHDHGINTFKDDPELRGGEIISHALLDAIRKSKTYIVVLSKNYASSTWCLDELAEILNCHKTRHRLVIPVFYNIEPSIVRHQTGSYQQAFKKHQNRYRDQREKVNNWRFTLTEVAGFSGHHISEDRSEADVINKIVDELLLKINPKTLDVTKYPVGLDSRVTAITTLMSSDTKGVIKFGIYGMGGVGKTTLAKALFNQLVRGGRFKGSCFLAKVAETSRTKGLEYLQQQLVNDVLNSTTKVEVHSVEEGINYIRERISSAEILVLIDDIYNLEQYESLVGSFACGSVVIITTRDEEMLDKVGVEPNYRYMLKELNVVQSRELFTKYAFEKAEPTENLLALSEDILGLAGGLPLALQIFGSYLSIKKELGWKSYIKTLQQYPNSTIEQKLLISLDALESDDRVLKKIFIDIACFFVGWEKEKVVKVLGTYYFHADEKIDTLKKRCLLTVNKETLEMHDLLRDLGRNVARNKAPDEPEKYSRLWVPEDIEDVLKNHTGTVAIEGIIPHNLYNLQEALEGKPLATETFKSMRKLRFLYLRANLTGSFEQMFEDLRVLRWEYCPLKCLPSDFYPKKLVILELPQSDIKTMWDLSMVSHVFGKLKTLNMSFSQELTTTPDFTKLPCLETLNLEYCRSLEEVHMSIGSLSSLVSLDLHGCVKLRSLPDTICNLKALIVLNIRECRLEALPDSIGSLTKLVELDVSNNKKLETLPDTMCNLRSLETLSISGCKKLETLPDELWKITRLRELIAEETQMLKKLPDIGSSQIALSLQELHLSGSSINALPSGFSQLSNLRSLDLSCCRHLFSIPKLPPNLKQIKANSCESLERLPNLSNLKQLETLDLSSCSGLTENHDLEELTALRCLDLRRCSGLARRHLTKRLVKVYSEFGHQISVYVSEFVDDQKIDPQWSDWILESPYWTSGELSESTKLYAHLLPNESRNFMGIILCFIRSEHCTAYNMKFSYSVKNTTSDFIWSMKVGYPDYGSLMVIVPKSIFSVKDDDNKIELTADNTVKIVGIHLLYKTEIKTIEDVVEKHVIDIEALKLIDPVLHDIFLDIACFFIGWQKKRVVQILDTYYTNVPQNIDILKKACLLKITEWDQLEMDDLLQYQGRKIASNNCLEEPEKHSRLWRLTDIYDALKKHMGTEVIEGIVPHKVYPEFDEFHPEFYYDDALTGESFTLEAFKKMRKLRFLYLRKIHLSGNFEHTFQDLRWLYWDWCPLKYLPSEFYPPKLVILELHHSNIITMWERNMVPHVFKKLKTLDMSGSEDLTTTPDFTKLPCLETLHLEGCKSLEEVHISIGSLVRLVCLNLHGCVNLRSLPDTICNLGALEVLDIRDCSCLEELPMALGNIQSLRELNAGNLTVSVLPDSTGHLYKLVKLRLNSNKNLKNLPVTICNLRSLEILDISGCVELDILPDQLCTVTSLRELIARGTTLLKKFPHVESSQMTLSLQKLDFSQSGITALPSSISKLLNLEDLNLKYCPCLLSIPELPCNLKWIRAKGCMSMERLPNLSNLKQLKYLNLEDCSCLTEIQGLTGLTSLITLHLKGCNSSLLAYIFTENFFQMYSEFGHPIKICSTDFPEWISQSSKYNSRMCLHLPPNVSHNHLGMILCIRSLEGFALISYSVENTTSDFIMMDNIESRGDKSWMVIVPRSRFSVNDGDDRIILDTWGDEKVYGIHLLYKTEEHRCQ